MRGLPEEFGSQGLGTGRPVERQEQAKARLWDILNVILRDDLPPNALYVIGGIDMDREGKMVVNGMKIRLDEEVPGDE